MDLLNNLAVGFATALSLQNLLYCFLGVTLGTLIGVLPITKVRGRDNCGGYL